MNPVPLCVDLDGTLVRCDTLQELALAAFKKNPFVIFLFFFWILRGKAFLKARLAAFAELDETTLPYSETFLTWLRAEYQTGRKIILATGANHLIAKKIANYLGIFADVFASDDNTNLVGKNKRRLLANTFGKKGYDYAGNEKKDLKVWEQARNAIVVNSRKNLINKVAAITHIEKTFISNKKPFLAFLRAIRIHQYAKNLLVFVPLITGHLYLVKSSLIDFFLGFSAFCLLVSSVYILNDLLDLQADRQHPTKCHRPFAQGMLMPSTGVILLFFFTAAAFLLALTLPIHFLFVLIGYYCLTFLYSVYLKRIELVDVFTLSSLYTLRIIAGMTLIKAGYSAWLLAFSLFFFLSLAFAKRYTELYHVDQSKKILAGRGYYPSDLSQIGLFGTVSGFIAVLVFALYINSEKVITLYRLSQLLWVICFILLFWISRLWLVASRGKLAGDPVLFALKDKTTLILAAFALFFIVFAG